MSWFRPRLSLQGTSIPRIGVNIPMPPGVKPPHESWETLAERIQRAASVLSAAPDWCDCCYGVFNKGWSDEEALQEAVNNFPFMKQEDARIVCDDCYKQIMAREAKEGRGDGLHS